MKKVITKGLCVYMLLGLLVAIGALFILQTQVSQRDNTRLSEERLDPTVLASNDRLMGLPPTLGVTELHVIDGNGFITHSTIPSYVGFDMRSGEQSAAFMAMWRTPPWSWPSSLRKTWWTMW